MSILNDIPAWLGTGIFGILTFVIGFFSKQFIDGRQKRIEERRIYLRRLEKLTSLLRDSKDIFRTQNRKVKQLMNMVREKVPANRRGRGYDAAFCYMYDKYTDEERSLHELIRNVTVKGLYPANRRLQDWLDEGYDFLSAPIAPSDLAKENDELRKMLEMLRNHLTWWFAQYDRDMVDYPNHAHALVYANDELSQGVPFPTEIGPVAANVVAGWRRHVKS